MKRPTGQSWFNLTALSTALLTAKIRVKCSSLNELLSFNIMAEEWSVTYSQSCSGPIVVVQQAFFKADN